MPAQQGISGDHDQFLRHDGTVGLTGNWNAALSISVARLYVASGGNFSLGDLAGWLRMSRHDAETLKITGVSNALAELNMKNSTIEDLAGIGVRAVVADVNGKLSAP